MRSNSKRIFAVIVFALLSVPLLSYSGEQDAEPLKAREIPARELPTPDTVSAPMQSIIGKRPASWPALPKTASEWDHLTRPPSDIDIKHMADKFRVSVTSETVGGVMCYVITPKTIENKNKRRLMIDLHHGGFIFGAKSGLDEAVAMASLVGYKMLEVDYRVLPHNHFPDAMDDAMAVWKAVSSSANPANVAIVGSSAGGGMVLSVVQRARREGLPLPGAIMVGTPWSDLSKTGDSYYTNENVDNVLTSYDKLWHDIAKLYANGRSLKDPLVSPVYGDFNGFPPTYLVTGTRDLWLSNTVRVQEKLLEAAVPTQLEVQEALPHGGYLVAAQLGAPEAVHLYLHISRFFDAHLGQ